MEKVRLLRLPSTYTCVLRILNPLPGRDSFTVPDAINASFPPDPMFTAADALLLPRVTGTSTETRNAVSLDSAC